MNYDIKSFNKSLTQEEQILGLIRKLFIVDYGIITEVSADKKRVSVNHVTKAVKIDIADNGKETEMPPMTTHDIELLHLGSSTFGLTYDVAVGDVVLLLGSRTLVEPIEGKTAPEKPKMYSYYRPENLKAIPLKTATSVTVNVTVDTNGMKIDATGKEIDMIFTTLLLGSLTATEPFVKGDVFATQYNSLITALKTFADGLTTVNLAANAATLTVTLTTLLTLINNFKSTKIKGE